MSKTYKNTTNSQIVVDIPVEYDQNGNPTKYKSHTLDPNEEITFDDTQNNGSDVISECIAKSLIEI